jgi:hypothetical protein
MQENLDLGVTSVGITLGSSGTDVNVTGSPITTSGNITINFPTASATNRGLLSSADWTTFNDKQPAGNYVTLDTAQTITAQKVFTTSGSSDSVIITHGSGSGFALDVIKAGNGEVIRVNKTSGSGNAMTVIGGDFEAPTIVKTGGTSSEFLKADGSVDSNSYVTLNTTQTISGTKTFTTLNYTTFTNNDFFQAEFSNGSSKLNLGSASNIGHIASNGDLRFNTNYPTDALASPKLTIASNGQATFSVDAVINGVSIGKGAGGSVDFAYNTAIGFGALVSNTTGLFNTAVGFNALANHTTGNNQVALGLSAGRYINSGANNVLSSSSVYLGNDTRASASGNSNEIVIGHEGRGNGSNTVTIGNSSITNTYLRGTVQLTDTGTASSINIISDSTGNGAINIIKNTNGTGIRVSNAGIGQGIFANNSSTGTGILIGNTSTGKGLYIDNAFDATGDPFVYTLGGAAFVKAKIDYLGNLTAVGATLTGALNGTSASFSSTITATDAVLTKNGDITIKFNPNNVAKWDLYYNNADGTIGFYDRVGSAFRMTLAQTGAATFSSSVTAGALSKIGDVFIGGRSGTYASYSDGVFGDNLHLGATGTGAAVYINTALSRNLIINPVGGNVGIGTDSPNDLMEIKSSTVNQANYRLYNTFNDGANNFGINWFRNYDSATNSQGAFINYVRTGGSSGDLAFGTGTVGAITERMRITSVGQVGIGTNDPARQFVISNGGADGIEFTQIASQTTEIITYNRSTSAYTPLQFESSSYTFNGGNVTIVGSLSKGSGSFKIDHPIPSKKDTHHLVHSFVEAPQADNIYRGKIELTNGYAEVNIDEASGMTEGTFIVLNGNIQCFTSNESGWTAIRGKVEGNILKIQAQDSKCIDTISWLVIGERIDQHMIDTDWTDENGKVIVEPLKDKVEIVEEQNQNQTEDESNT